MASNDPAASDPDASLAALIPLGSHSNSAPIELKRPVLPIGSRKDIVRLHLQSSTVSKVHCVVVTNRWGCYVHDLASRTGTLVNGKPVTDHDLADGDVLQVGRFQFRYRAPARPKAKPPVLPPADVTVSTLTGPLTVHKRVILIGRRVGSDVQFEDSRVSNLHALIIEQDGRRLVRDLSSRTGTWLDEKPVHQEPLADGASLRVGGATLSIVDRPAADARDADAPLTLADAPTPAGAAAGVAAIDLLDLEPLDDDLADDFDPAGPDDTVPAADDADDLAALRRGWKAPPRDTPLPVEPTRPAAEAPAPAPAEPIPVAPLPIDAPLPLELEPESDIRPVAAEADGVVKDDDLDTDLVLPAAEAPAVVESEVGVDADDAETRPASEASDPDLLDDNEIDTVVDSVPQADATPPAESDALERIAVEPEPLAESAEPVVVAEAPTPVVDERQADATADEETDPAVDAARPDADTPIAEPHADEVDEAESVVGVAVDEAAATEVPTDVAADAEVDAKTAADGRVEAETVDADALILDEAAPTADDVAALPVDALDLAPEAAPADDGSAATPPTSAGVSIPAQAEEDGALDLPSLDLSDLHLEPDADAPAPAVAPAGVAETGGEGTESVEAIAPDADAPAVPDPDAPAPVDIAERPAMTAEKQAELDLSDVSDDLSDTAATSSAASKIADIDAELDLIDLKADAEADDAAVTPDAAAEAFIGESPTAEQADADTLISLPTIDDEAAARSSAGPVLGDADDRDVEMPSPGRTLVQEADDRDASDRPVPEALIGSFVEPIEPPPEPDLVRLSEEADDEENEATALAVDLGLVLDDDAPEPLATSGPVPAGPVDIDLANATPVAREPETSPSIDLSRPGPMDAPAFHPRPVADAPFVTADPSAEDLFDADSIDLIEPDAAPEPWTERPAASAETPETPDAEDRNTEDRDAENRRTGDEDADAIAPPAGGSLADLMPGGPPLLGGSFMALPPAPSAETEAGGRRRPLRVGFGGETRPGGRSGGRPGRAAPFAADRTIADALGGPATDDDIDDLIGHAPSVDAFSGQPLPPAKPAAKWNAPTPTAPADAESVSAESVESADVDYAPRIEPSTDDLPEPLLTESLAESRRAFEALRSSRTDRTTANDDFAPTSKREETSGDRPPEFDDEDDRPLNERLGITPKDKADGKTAEQADTPLFDDVDARPAAATMTSELAVPADRFRPRGTIRAALPAGDARVASVTPADVDLARSQRHKKRVRRVIACLVGMVVLIGGAAWGVYYFTPLRSTVDALISYEGLDRLGLDEAAQFRVRQNETLVSEPVRQTAVQALPPSITAGFLSDGRGMIEAIDRDAKVRWPADQKTVLRLRVRSDDKENDIARLRALANTLVATADADRDRINELRNRNTDDQNQAGQRKVQLADLNDQLQALQQATNSRPEVRNLSELNAEFLAAEPALTGIKSKRQELEATVDRLGKPAAKPESGPAVDPVAADEELAKLAGELNELTQPVARPENTAAGAEARKTLDESIATFQQDLASAQKMQNSPELTAYVDAANRAFTEYRTLIDIFIRYQENQLTQLSELKTKLSDSMQAQAQELIAKDTELKKLKDRLGILTRQYNAAVGQGMEEKVRESDLALRLMKVKVAEREDQLTNNSVSGEAIKGLQNVIDGIEKDRRNGRRQFDERLTAMQTEFMRNAPAVEKLPAEQKALAEGIEGKLTAVNEARRAYNAAAETAQAEQAKKEAASAEQAAALRMKIAARRQDVLAAAQARQAENDEATRKQLLATAQADLAGVRQQEQSAQERVVAAANAIEQQEKQRRLSAQGDTERQARLAARDNVERELRTIQGTIATRQAQLARLIVPDRKVELNSYDDPDRRPLYAAGAGVLIVLLLGIPMLLDLLALAREAHPPEAGHVRDEDDDTEGFEPVIVEDAQRKALPEPASV